MQWLLLIPLIPAAAMALSDFRSRHIALAWLVVFAVCTVTASVAEQGLMSVAHNALYNTVLMVFMGAFVWLYLCVKHRRVINPLDDNIGLGDVLFIWSLTPLWSIMTFLPFLIISFVAAILWWLAVGRKATIPLVGIMGITLSVYQLYNFATYGH